MRTTPDFILSQPRLHFAAHIRNVTPNAVSIPVEIGELERQPILSSEAFEELRQRNRKRVSLTELVGDDAFPYPDRRISEQVKKADQHRTNPRSPSSDDSDDLSAPSEDW